MKFEVDTHTHTVLSGHAQSTLLENAAAAAKAGVRGIVLTDHGPQIPSASPDFTISTYSSFPKIIDGVRVYFGTEANIMDYSGTIDVREKYMQMLDFAIAGLHGFTIDPGTREQNTDAVIGAINNKYVDMISHPDNPSYEIDYEAFVKETGRLEKIVEVNEHSIWYRKDSAKNALVYLELCKKHSVRVAVSSDAHISLNIGVCNTAAEVLKQCSFPQELIVNLTKERFDEYIMTRAGR
jgi:putative hydrolase